MKYATGTFVFLLSLLFTLSPAHGKWLGKDDKDIHERHRAMQEMGEQGEAMFVDVTLHDEELLNSEGKKVKFVTDVIGDRLAAITFIYTNCTTICPVFQAIFADLQGMLGDRLGKEVVLITMSLDPTRDIPPRMKIEAAKWNAKPEWIHLTGKKQVMDKVLQGLDAYFADFTQHPPMALVGDGKAGKWKRYNGFPKPEELLAMLDGFKMARRGGQHKDMDHPGHHGEEAEGEHEKHHEMHHEGETEGQHHDTHHGAGHEKHHEMHDGSKTGSGEDKPAEEQENHHDMKPEGQRESKVDDSGIRGFEDPKTRKHKGAKDEISEEEKGREYFTDLPVVDQEGKNLKFFSDVLKDRVVLITMYYTDCGLACPITMQKLKDVEAVIGDRLGKDIFFVGLSVDSANDSPEMVKEFLKEYDAYKDGYIFLTGEERVLDHIIYKLGQYRPDKEYHSTMMIIGNVKTGHWAKVNPTYPPSTIGVRLKLLADEG